jgi:hypothetical protein
VTPEVTLISNEFFLRRSNTLKFLDELEKTVDSSAKSIYTPPGLSVPEIKEMLGQAGVHSLPDELAVVMAKSKNGAALFRGITQKCLVLPPFPIREKATFSGYAAQPLQLLLKSDYKIGIILIHLGSYAIGVCQGEKIITSKVGTGLVHGRHKKGGSSQQRFQRHRQNQIQEFLDRVCGHVLERLEPEARHLDYVVYGGPRQTILQLQKRCPLLISFEDRTLPLLEVPSPRQKILETTVHRIWSSRVIEWQENPERELPAQPTAQPEPAD